MRQAMEVRNKENSSCLMCRCMAVILALKKQRQEDRLLSKVILVNIVYPRLSRAL